MAEIPVYRQSMQVEDPGAPQVRLGTVTPAASDAQVAEAQAGIGKAVEGIGAELERHIVMQDGIEAQQQGYEAAAKYNQELQKFVAQEKQNMGMNAKGGAERLRAAFDGSPAMPGQPRVAPAREQFANGLGLRARKSFERTALAHETVASGQIINHEITQTNRAKAEISQTTISNQIDSGNVIHSPVEMQKAHDALGQLVDSDLYLKSQHTPEEIANMKKGFLDKQAEAAVTARAHEDYRVAQKLLDTPGLKLSDAMRTHLQQKVIDPARVEQYVDAGTNAVFQMPPLRNPETMQIDEVAAHQFVAEKVNEANLPAGHQQQTIDKIMANVKAENSRLDDHEKQAKDSAILALHKMAKDPNATLQDAEAKIIKTAPFKRGSTFHEVEDFAARAFSKDPMAGEAAWKSAPKPVQDFLDFRKAEIDKKFPYPDDKSAFLSIVRQRLLDSGVRTADQAQELYKKAFEETPTGAPRFFGVGHQSKPQYAIDQELSKDITTVKALGGFDKARAVAQDLGGPDKLAKAVDVLKQNKYPVTVAALQSLKAKRPDLLK